MIAARAPRAVLSNGQLVLDVVCLTDHAVASVRRASMRLCALLRRNGRPTPSPSGAHGAAAAAGAETDGDDEVLGIAWSLARLHTKFPEHVDDDPFEHCAVRGFVMAGCVPVLFGLSASRHATTARFAAHVSLRAGAGAARAPSRVTEGGGGAPDD